MVAVLNNMKINYTKLYSIIVFVIMDGIKTLLVTQR